MAHARGLAASRMQKTRPTEGDAGKRARTEAACGWLDSGVALGPPCPVCDGDPVGPAGASRTPPLRSARYSACRFSGHRGADQRDAWRLGGQRDDMATGGNSEDRSICGIVKTCQHLLTMPERLSNRLVNRQDNTDSVMV